MSAKSLTTTSYAVLSLLALRPWSTYELTGQMDRSVGRVWPRTRSKLFEEPRKLVAHGLATATTESTGRRRTVYTITEQGRAALARWHREPGEGPVLEFEQLLKVGFAEHGTRDDALASLAAARDWSVERNVENLAAARAYLTGTAPFQGRAAQTMLVGRFLTDFYRLVADWADWAASVVEDWPDDLSEADPDPDELLETARRAAWSDAAAATATPGPPAEQSESPPTERTTPAAEVPTDDSAPAAPGGA